MRRPRAERVPLQVASNVDEVWSMDFVSDSLANGRQPKCLTVADDLSHECVDITVDYGNSGEYVTRLLDRTTVFRGYPAAVRTDNGPEFASRAFIAWTHQHHVRHLLFEAGKPMQNGYIESFNGKSRDERLDEHWFQTCSRPARPSRTGGATTTTCGRTAASGACRQLASPSSTAGMPAVLLTKPRQPTRSRHLQPGLLPKHWYGGRGQVMISGPIWSAMLRSACSTPVR